MKTLKVLRFVVTMLVVVVLASCGSDDHVEKRLTHGQKEAYAQNISGEYRGRYIIVYADKDSKEWINEEGRRVKEAHEEDFDGMLLDVSDFKMQHVFFHDFPVSLISRVVDADESLRKALAEAPPSAITGRYGFDYDTDYERITWAFVPDVMALTLNYGGADHHIRVEFNNNSQYYRLTEDRLKQPRAFSSLAAGGISLQLEAIYDGSTLLQRFGFEDGNFMHIVFRAD